MKLQIAALVLLTAASVTIAQEVHALTPTETKQRQEIIRRQEQRHQQNLELRDQQRQRNGGLRERQGQEETHYEWEREDQEQEQQGDARREWEEERDRRQQDEARREREEEHDRRHAPDYYEDHYYEDHDDDDYDNRQRDRYERPDWYDWYQDSDDWNSQERERLEQERQEESARSNQERTTRWRDWEHQQNVLRRHWDDWQRTYRPALVGTTLLEITSLDNNWSTVSIEGLNIAQEVSFTGSGVQTVYLSPGAYRIRFSPVLSDDSWQSGYLVVGRTNRLRIVFDQNNESVQILDDPEAWTPGDRLPGYLE